MLVARIAKKQRLTLRELIRFQILTHGYFRKIALSEADLDCLTDLAFRGETDLTDFCRTTAELGIFRSSQSVRNAISRYEKQELVEKSGEGRKQVRVSPELELFTGGSTLLELNLLGLETP